MKKFTFISELREGIYRRSIYINQYTSVDLYRALLLWADNLDVNIFTHRGKMNVQKDVRDAEDIPAAIEAVDNVWFNLYILAGASLFLNIVETAAIGSQKDRATKKLTVIAYFRGGIYISQYKSVDAENALSLWIDNLDIQYWPYRDQVQIRKKRVTMSQSLAPVEGVDNIWHVDCMIYRSLLSLYIIETAV
jgi:hypothetical protein